MQVYTVHYIVPNSPELYTNEINEVNGFSQLNSSKHQTFQWHERTALRIIRTCDQNIPPTKPSILNNTHYIADSDCENTLLSVRQSLMHEFCVHPPQYLCTADSTATPFNKNEYQQADESRGKNHKEQSSFFQCMSSGSDGQPKRIRRTHDSWIASFKINAKLANITADDSYAIIGRLSHSLALYAALEAAHLGADIHALTELRPDKQLNAITTLASTILYATPTQLRLLCFKADKIDAATRCVRQIFCGGGKLDQRTTKLVQKVFPHANIREFYGATESSFITMSDNTTPLGSVGKLYPGVELLVKNGENKDGIANLNIGEIWVRSPYTFCAYADNFEQTAHWHDGYVSVGEFGHMDNQGYLFIAGRQSRRVNISDKLVYPEEIENILNEHPEVSHCALIPIADESRGSVLMALVEAQDSAVLKQELLVYLRLRVGNLKAPRDIKFVSTLPLLPSGKPDLKAIEQQLANSTAYATSTIATSAIKSE